MSEQAIYRIKALEFCYNSSYLDYDFAGMLFTNEDLDVEKNVKYDDDEDEIPHDEYKYKTTIKKAIERLNAIGITEKNVEKEFNEKISKCMDYDGFFSHLNIPIENWEEKQIERTNKHVTFRKWKNALSKFINYELEHGKICYYSGSDVSSFFNKTNECEKIIYYSKVTDWDENGMYGIRFDCIDPIKILRIIFSCCPQDAIIELDVTNLIGYSYDSIDELMVNDPTPKNIVLVEGTSDKWILEFAFHMLYPHLENLFYFMDFEWGNGSKRPGGVDNIANNTKAFIASRLKANFIAIFDNDSAGVQKKQQLENEISPVPDNVRILNYPNIDEAKNYPTLAPNGKIVADNINKRACSIELYLPDDLLKDANGNLFPVIWTSLINYKINGQTIKSYQGVIDGKDEIKSQTESYINDVKNGRCIFDEFKWKKMKSLLDCLINAF